MSSRRALWALGAGLAGCAAGFASAYAVSTSPETHVVTLPATTRTLVDSFSPAGSEQVVKLSVSSARRPQISVAVPAMAVAPVTHRTSSGGATTRPATSVCLGAISC